MVNRECHSESRLWDGIYLFYADYLEKQSDNQIVNLFKRVEKHIIITPPLKKSRK